jgi:very-short-patch-repair endonuclease
MRGNIGGAKRLRRDQTDAERALWFRLRDRRLSGLKFRRQVPINQRVVDFCCADARLVIELDGGQHATRAAEDQNRTKILEAMGYLILRFWNNDVMRNIEGVLEEILRVARLQRSEPPHPNPLPFGERERA